MPNKHLEKVKIEIKLKTLNLVLHLIELVLHKGLPILVAVDTRERKAITELIKN